jgi:hypothetical protein
MPKMTLDAFASGENPIFFLSHQTGVIRVGFNRVTGGV